VHTLIAFLDLAYDWLCRQRRDFPADSDVWDLRFHWCRERKRLVEELRTGQYRFVPMSVITKANGEVIHLWSARDALVLKALALMISPLLRLSRRCVHVKGHGGLKAAVREVQQRLPDYRFVLRTDVKDCYESIDQSILLEQLRADIDDPYVLGLLGQAIRRTVERGGLYWEIRTGISRGCPLSPLLGALYLRVLDERLSERDVYYVRYMDDILVLAKTRWQLRRAVRVLNSTFAELKVSQHPEKTFIGRIERGFDFLGYHFSRRELAVAKATICKSVEKASRLYEQERKRLDGPSRLGMYIRRWIAWARGGISDARLELAVSVGVDILPGCLLRSPPTGTAYSGKTG